MNQDDVEFPVNSRGDGDHLVLPSSQGGNDVEENSIPPIPQSADNQSRNLNGGGGLTMLDENNRIFVFFQNQNRENSLRQVSFETTISYTLDSYRRGIVTCVEIGGGRSVVWFHETRVSRIDKSAIIRNHVS
ncbi:uncharacterized protein GVI51_F08327 [Nakaseomyces glabratus]|uniref:Uncharacterized protein n=1 Tax=Candida glabrata (strain ATCC 2001 / BCRC 20586 / JCM 3761 / NBRC 0622 / NRRL Y-65 / CBS 138) TaxID=284593 RepID=Q6FTU4_CANGA|nr:uncharacterized protein CAGL0F08767g [Nakaseomyces glabratus]QHS65981.1 uncharacterized protein GVI51_F08327 [Nakaseomyces glabratus]CAG59274.1 unnamed protein product [Nakaseomyces glabratus]|eukprot:XP_446350.1 uncharacterized protein CAGL0F08767g [[Candida] glabrata]